MFWNEQELLNERYEKTLTSKANGTLIHCSIDNLNKDFPIMNNVWELHIRLKPFTDLNAIHIVEHVKCFSFDEAKEHANKRLETFIYFCQVVVDLKKID